jgi:nitroreductase
MDAIECMKTRRSVRTYLDKPVPKEIIKDIVDCGRLAATAINIQPWVFVAVQDAENRKKIADITDHGKFIEHAPACIVVLCLDSKYYLEDGCAAVQNILNAATAHGLGSCWVAGDKKEYAPRIVELLGAPNDFKLVALVSIGYTDQQLKPVKKPLSEVLKWEKF